MTLYSRIIACVAIIGFMKSSLRPTSVDDLSALSQFLARAFGFRHDAPSLNPAVMAWKYWDHRDDWTGPRSYVLEKDGAIVAHAGIWPVTFGTGADAVRGIHMIDWASAKESAGTGLALVQKLAGMFDFIFSIGGSEMTRKVLPAFGFVEHTRVWKGSHPLRPLQQILTHQTRNWKLAPRLAQNYLLAMKGVTPYKGWKAKEIEPQEISREIPWEVADARCSPRPPAFFEYLLRCPAARVSLHGIFDEVGELGGHFAISVLRGQVRIAGIWLRESTQETFAAAYFVARRSAQHLKGANEIVTIGSEGVSREGATRAGFRIMPGAPVYVLDKKKKLPLSPGFQFQLSDDDAAFLDVGTADYWS
jgi:hypothetical protein